MLRKRNGGGWEWDERPNATPADCPSGPARMAKKKYATVADDTDDEDLQSQLSAAESDFDSIMEAEQGQARRSSTRAVRRRRALAVACGTIQETAAADRGACRTLARTCTARRSGR